MNKQSILLLKPFRITYWLGFLGLMILGVAQAQEVQNTHVQNTTEVQAEVVSGVVGSAKDWGVSDEDWQRYQQLMSGPAGKWYPQLSPAEVLGMYADNDQDKRKFAELAAREEHDKVQREIEFNNAFHAASVRLYANEPVIKDFDMSAFTPHKGGSEPVHHGSSVSLQAGDHLVLFVDTKSGMDFLSVPPLLSLIQTHSGVFLDIYCVGANVTDQDIQNWAKLNSIPVELVNKGTITLNPDNGKMKSIFGSGSLPSVVLVRNGITQMINLPKLM